MDTRSPLHWSALLLGLFAASWMLITIIPGLIFLLPLFAVAGFVLALVAARKLPEEQRTVVRVGAAIGVILYGLWIVLMLASQPVNIKNVGNHQPPAFLAETSETLGQFLPALGAIAVLATFWAIWHRREQILAGIGAALVVLIPLIPTPAEEIVGTLMVLAYAVGWLLLAIATLLPILRPDDAHPAWTPRSPAA